MEHDAEDERGAGPAVAAAPDPPVPSAIGADDEGGEAPDDEDDISALLRYFPFNFCS